MMKTLAKISTLALYGCLSAACGDSLTDNNYDGDARMVVDGTVQSLAAGSTGGTHYVALLWTYDHGDGDEFSAQIAPVQSTTFPASFRLAITTNPADDQLQDFSDRGDGQAGLLGTGHVFVGEDRDGDGALGPDESDENSLAISDTHVVLFVKNLNQVAKDSLRGNYILNPEDLQEGYNLAEFVCNTTGNDVFDHLRVVPDTDVSIRSSADVEADNFPCMNIQ